MYDMIEENLRRLAVAKWCGPSADGAMPGVGQEAPDFSLKDHTGNEARSREVNSKMRRKTSKFCFGH